MGASPQLRAEDARAALAFAGEVAACRDPAQLDAQIAGLPRLVGAEGAMVTACRDWAGEVLLELGDPALYPVELLNAIDGNWRQHPVLRLDLARADPGARRLSDFVRPQQWRRGGLFNNFYRPLGMTHELSAQLSWGPAGSSCCVALHRGGRDFSERELALLAAVTPHLRAARARFAAEKRAARWRALLERGADGMGGGAVVIARNGTLLAISRSARDQLKRWFESPTAVLPPELSEWRTAAQAGLAPSRLEVGRGERRLRARLLPGEEADLVLLSERDDAAAAAQLARQLPITRREAEVLARLAAGRTNDGIALDLGISRHTVVRHIEHIYAKLDVHTRAAATRAALEALGDWSGVDLSTAGSR